MLAVALAGCTGISGDDGGGDGGSTSDPVDTTVAEPVIDVPGVAAAVVAARRDTLQAQVVTVAGPVAEARTVVDRTFTAGGGAEVVTSTQEVDGGDVLAAGMAVLAAANAGGPAGDLDDAADRASTALAFRGLFEGVTWQVLDAGVLELTIVDRPDDRLCLLPGDGAVTSGSARFGSCDGGDYAMPGPVGEARPELVTRSWSPAVQRSRATLSPASATASRGALDPLEGLLPTWLEAFAAAGLPAAEATRAPAPPPPRGGTTYVFGGTPDLASAALAAPGSRPSWAGEEPERVYVTVDADGAVVAAAAAYRGAGRPAPSRIVTVTYRPTP